MSRAGAAPVPAGGTDGSPLVLSVQSHVAYGHVGNAAATLPLQLLGIEPVTVHTVQFSNHTGYGEFKGQVFTAAHIADVLDGLRARGTLQRCRAVLSGYLGDAAIGECILSAVAEIRRSRPEMIYLCDPVIGDVGRGVFVRPDIPAFLRDRAVPAATVITPNQFEFEWLTGKRIESLASAIDSARGLLGGVRDNKLQAGPGAVVITSLIDPARGPEQLTTLGVTADEAWAVRTPSIALAPLPNGMGDVFSALLLGRLLLGQSFRDALSLAVDALFALVSRTAAGDRDLPLIAARDQIATPTRHFVAEPV